MVVVYVGGATSSPDFKKIDDLGHSYLLLLDTVELSNLGEVAARGKGRLGDSRRRGWLVSSFTVSREHGGDHNFRYLIDVGTLPADMLTESWNYPVGLS